MNENAFEHFTQVCILIIVIILKNTRTRTVTVLDELFAGGGFELIVLSALWSFFSLVVGFLAWISLHKGNFLPKRGQIILALFALFSLLARISSVVLFFAPAMGLFNLLGHFTVGHLPTTDDVIVYDLGDNNGTASKDFKMAWGDPVSCYTDLTVFSLEKFYIAFLFLILVHYVCLAVIKFGFALDFRSRKSSSSWLEKLFHVLSQLVYPINFRDWDEDSSSSSKIILELDFIGMFTFAAN